MGPGPNNCPGILCEKNTIEGKRGGGGKRRKIGGEDGREKKEVQIQLRSGVILDPNRRAVQMSRLPDLQGGYHGIISPCSQVKSNVSGRIVIHQWFKFNLEPTQIHSIPHPQ